MSARKKVNQSRPRALARAAASRVAGAVCFDTADEAKPPPARRSSRPPSNSSANADSPMSPAPSGITASVLAECPVQSATPLYFLRHAAPGHARQRVAAVFARESECAKAAILRSRGEFHGNRYHGAASFVTEKSGVFPRVPTDGTSAGPCDSSSIHLVIHYPRRFARSRRPRKPFAATPAIVLTERPRKLLRRIKGARALEETGAAGKAFLTCARGSRRSP